jgi:glycosyltransferase involved in cell wall biosynthesis
MEQALERADAIFAWSPFLRESYIRYGLAEEKVRVGAGGCEPPGVDLERFYPLRSVADDKFVVLHMTSITVIKGVQYLLEAWANIAGKIDGDLVLVGQMDRDMRRIFKRYTGAGITWAGPSSDPASWYRKASVFVSPSLSDAGPRTVLESMACGVPAIVSDRCGISTSIQPEQNGFVYRHDDVDRLAELIMWCYRNRNETRGMGQMALDTVKRFSVANYSADVWQRVNEVV